MRDFEIGLAGAERAAIELPRGPREAMHVRAERMLEMVKASLPTLLECGLSRSHCRALPVRIQTGIVDEAALTWLLMLGTLFGDGSRNI